MTAIPEPDESGCKELARSIPSLFRGVDSSTIMRAIETDDLYLLSEIPDDVRRQFENCRAAVDDLYWYAEIKSIVDVEDYPCIHLAHACSEVGRKIISRHLGLFSIRFDANGDDGIVIGNCPWCGIQLNISAQTSAPDA